MIYFSRMISKKILWKFKRKKIFKKQKLTLNYKKWLKSHHKGFSDEKSRPKINKTKWKTAKNAKYWNKNQKQLKKQ